MCSVEGGCGLGPPTQLSHLCPAVAAALPASREVAPQAEGGLVRAPEWVGPHVGGGVVSCAIRLT